VAVINPEVIPSNIKLKRTPINVTKFFGKRGGGGGALSESGGSGAIIRSSSSGIVSNLASLDPVDRPLSLEEKVDRNQKKITIIKNILTTHLAIIKNILTTHLGRGGGGALSKSGGSGSIIRSSSSSIVPNLASLDPVDRPLSLEEKVDRNQKKITIIKNILTTHQTNHGNQRGKLEEINAILNDIGNALALDFAHRISDAKNIGKQLRRQASKDKFKKERGVFKGALGLVGKATNKMIAPLKNMFKKIWNSLQWVVGGILANEAFNWLKDPQNQQKLLSTLDFLITHWKWFFGLFLAGLVANIAWSIRNLWWAVSGVLRSLGGIGRFITTGKFKPGGVKGPRGNPRSWKNTKNWRFPWQKPPVSGGTGRGIGSRLFGKGSALRKTANFLKIPKFLKWGNRILGPLLIGLDIWDRKKRGHTTTQTVAGVGGGLAGSALVSILMGMVIAPEPATTVAGAIGLGLLRMFGYAVGSTVADEITGANKVQSRDIGGSITKDRLYMVHQDELIRAPFSGTVERAQRAEQILKKSSTFKNRNIIPINLPDIVRPMPEIPDPQSGGEATESPMVSSLNGADHYRHLTASVYGIYV